MMLRLEDYCYPLLLLFAAAAVAAEKVALRAGVVGMGMGMGYALCFCFALLCTERATTIDGFLRKCVLYNYCFRMLGCADPEPEVFSQCERYSAVHYETRISSVPSLASHSCYTRSDRVDLLASVPSLRNRLAACTA